MTKQGMRVLEYIKTNGSITTRDCMTKLGIASPRDVIYELRQAGFDIKDHYCRGRNRYNEKVEYKRFFFAEGGAE